VTIINKKDKNINDEKIKSLDFREDYVYINRYGPKSLDLNTDEKPEKLLNHYNKTINKRKRIR